METRRRRCPGVRGGHKEEAEDAAGHVLQEHRPAQGDPAEGGPRVPQTPRHAVTKSKISNSTQQVCNSLTSRFE